MAISDQYPRVKDQVARQCVECGRDPSEVTLLGVSKTVGLDGVAEAIKAGAHELAENRPDNIVELHDAFPQVEWHFIGNVQSRHIPDIVRCSTLVHSVYQQHHLARFDRSAQRYDKVQRILLEVNVSGEESKSGLAPDDVPAMIEAASKFPHLRVCGLMTMAPRGEVQATKDCFAGLRDLRDQLKDDPALQFDNVELSELSMGMTEDWKYAIAAGSTIVRIGRAIFSPDFE